MDIIIDEASIPIRPSTLSACNLLGVDPLELANEGKLVAFVSASKAEELVSLMRGHRYGEEAAIIGEVTVGSGEVALRTNIGSLRLVASPTGSLVPRIC